MPCLRAHVHGSEGHALHAEGLTKAAIARSIAAAARTASRWLEKAAAHTRAFHDAHLHPHAPQHAALRATAQGGVVGPRMASFLVTSYEFK